MMKPYREPSSNHSERGIPLKSYSNFGIVPWHWHDEFEFLYVRSGNAVCHLEKVSFPVQAGSLILLCDRSPHTMLPAEGTDLLSLTYDAVVFHPSIFHADLEPVQRFFYPPYLMKRVLTPETVVEQNIIDLERELFKAASEKPFGYEFLLLSLVPRIFSGIFNNGLYSLDTTIPPVKAPQKNISKVIKYISDHYSEKMELAKLAQLASYSPPYFSRLFKEYTGKTTCDFINYYRVHKAANLLCSTDMSVLDIACATGFDNLGHFIKTFKRYIGKTPYQYRLSA